MTPLEFKVGDRVFLPKETLIKQFDYLRDDSNPTDCFGVVIQTYDAYYPYYVRWDNGKTNIYREGDLRSESEKKDQQRFWLVLQDGMHVTYKTYDDAFKKAQHLAMKNPGTKFFVLGAVAGAVGTVTVQKEEFWESEIPF